MITQQKLLVVSPEQIDQNQIILTSEQIHYLCHVLRLKSGDSFIAMNGQGQQWLSLLKMERDQIHAEIQTEIATQTELPMDVVLIAALPKGNGFDEVVRQVTELGVTHIIPLLSERTLLKPSLSRVERWRRIATEAAEQSERQRVPVILEPISLSQGWAEIRAAIPLIHSRAYICVARGEFPHLLNCLLEQRQEMIAAPQAFPLLIAVGPEGGWTPTEVEEAISHQFQPVSLGPRILRAVTVPGVVLSLVTGVFHFKSNM